MKRELERVRCPKYATLKAQTRNAMADDGSVGDSFTKFDSFFGFISFACFAFRRCWRYEEAKLFV